jgi:hypothetical protein
MSTKMGEDAKSRDKSKVGVSGITVILPRGSVVHAATGLTKRRDDAERVLV